MTDCVGENNKGRPCRNDPVAGTPYCTWHLHLLEVDTADPAH
ncbi:hypothetical protein [Haloferax volcanii]|nr:hypothetical protein [Haloferax alexandrinus]